MGIAGLIIGTLYGHFYNMKERGRKVIPWVNTVFVLSLEATMIIFSIIKIALDIFYHGYFQLKVPEYLFLGAFIFCLLSFFFLIKGLYFNTGKHLIFYQEYIDLPQGKKHTFRAIILTSLVLLPFILYLVTILDSIKYRR